jgi:hypothetical protein
MVIEIVDLSITPGDFHGFFYVYQTLCVFAPVFGSGTPQLEHKDVRGGMVGDGKPSDSGGSVGKRNSNLVPQDTWVVINGVSKNGRFIMEIWVNYNDLTGIMVNKRNHPQWWP